MDPKQSYVYQKQLEKEQERLVKAPRKGEDGEVKDGADGSASSMPLSDLAKLSKLSLKMSKTLPVPLPQLDQNLPEVVTECLDKIRRGKRQALMMIDSEPTTLITPFAVSAMERAKLMKIHAVKLVEAIRCSAQPNKAYRHKRLVPSDVGAKGDRVELALEIGNLKNIFDNVPPLAQYSAELVDSHAKIATYEDLFLRQVMKYSVKPLQQYADVIYPQMVKAYEDMVETRRKYDKARASKKQKKVDERRVILAQKSSVVEEYFWKIPEYQVSFIKAIDTYTRAEAHYFRQTRQLWKEMRPPDNEKRWRGLVK